VPNTNTKKITVLSGMILAAALVFLLCAVSTFSSAQSDSQPSPAAGAGSVLVHTKFGGQIFGFDIDQNGTEGILSEAQTLPSGNVLAAVETFDQTTGKILNVVSKTQTQDDFVTLGVVSSSVGLVEHEHVVRILKVQRSFHVLNPLTTNKFTGLWTPPIGTGFLIEEVSRNQGISTNAIFASGPNFNPVVFSSNIAANTFGSQITLTNQNFTFGVIPVLGYDSVTNQAVLAQDFGSPTNVPEVGLVNLTSGATTTFKGVGLGFVNGIAVDSADGIACTTTEIDFSVEFYNLATQTGFKVTLPGATQQIFSGADVEFDPVNKLFLVAQPVSSTAASGSSIHVYDPNGNLIESINGFSFSNASNVIPAHIALKPSNRTGFVDGPSATVSEIQSFTY
jgi:hypothetical protein